MLCFKDVLLFYNFDKNILVLFLYSILILIVDLILVVVLRVFLRSLIWNCLEVENFLYKRLMFFFIIRCFLWEVLLK